MNRLERIDEAISLIYFNIEDANYEYSTGSWNREYYEQEVERLFNCLSWEQQIGYYSIFRNSSHLEKILSPEQLIASKLIE